MPFGAAFVITNRGNIYEISGQFLLLQIEAIVIANPGSYYKSDLIYCNAGNYNKMVGAQHHCVMLGILGI